FADEKEPVVAGLLRALEKDKVADVRAEALGALMRTARPTVSVLRALGRALRDPDERVGLETAYYLEDRKVDVMPALRVAFSGEKPCATPRVIQIVRQLGAKARPLAPALLGLLWHRDPETRGEAAAALLVIDRRAFGRAVDAAFIRDARQLKGG